MGRFITRSTVYNVHSTLYIHLAGGNQNIKKNNLEAYGPFQYFLSEYSVNIQLHLPGGFNVPYRTVQYTGALQCTCRLYGTAFNCSKAFCLYYSSPHKYLNVRFKQIALSINSVNFFGHLLCRNGSNGKGISMECKKTRFRVRIPMDINTLFPLQLDN